MPDHFASENQRKKYKIEQLPNITHILLTAHIKGMFVVHIIFGSKAFHLNFTLEFALKYRY